MKKRIYLFATVLFAAALFNVSSVKAENYDWNENYSVGNRNPNNGSNGSNTNSPSNPGYGKTTAGGPSTSTNLPINNGVVFLFVAGIAIGIVTLKKFKSMTPAIAA